MIRKRNKFLSLIMALLIGVMSSVTAFAIPGDVSSITVPNTLVIGDYAFALNDSSYTLNNFLTAAQTVHNDGNNNQIYYNAGSAWYDLVANYERGLVAPFTGVFNQTGEYKYYDMKVADFKSTMNIAPTATFAWTAVPGATDVKIQQSPTGAGIWTDSNIEGLLVSDSNSSIVTGLTAGTSYDFKLVVTGGTFAGSSNVVTLAESTTTAAEVISSATYDVSTGNLVLTGLNFNTAATIDVTKLTITGQGGAGSQVTLTATTTNPTPASSTSATVAIAGTDETAVNAILIQNGITAPDSTTYNVAAASSWQTGAAANATIGITVSNAAQAPTVGITMSNTAEVISSATYDASSGNLVLIGLNFNTSATIDVTKLTITGQGGSTYTLTSATTNPTPASTTSATVVIAGVDKTSLNAILIENSTAAPDSTTYNLAAASGWQTGSVSVATVGITVSNYFVLDFEPNATIACSLTQLRESYAGPLIQVRRSSDGNTQNIYADSLGNLDVSSLSSFVGTGNGYVTTWYDQSGHGNNSTQIIAAKQPLIVNSGTIYTLNGAPTLYFDGNGYLNTASISLSQPDTIQLVGKYDVIKAGANFTDGFTTTKRQAIGQKSNKWNLYAGTGQSNGTLDTNSHIFTGVFNGANSQLNIDNTTVIDANSGRDVFTSQFIGAGYQSSSANGMIGRITEYIVYPFVLNRINSATYDASTGNLVLTGLNLNTASTIDVTKLTIKGQGSSTYTLTAATANPTPLSATSATVVIAGVDKTAVDTILNNKGTAALDLTTYNVAAASGWQSGAVAVSTVGTTVSNVAGVISSTTYNASTGNLVLTGLNFNTSAIIDVTKLTIAGQGGAGSQVVLTAATTNPYPASSTSVTIAIAGTDKTAVNAIMTQDGTTAPDSTIYNIATASGWQTGASAVSTVGITVSNAVELISMAVYNASTGNLVLTGLNFNTSAIIDVTKLTIKGQGGVSAQVTLTATTTNPTPISSTNATVAIAGADKTAVNAIMTQNGTTSPDSTTYNVSAASGWQTGTAEVSAVGITVSNVVEVISMATYDASSGNLVLTGLNFNTSATIDVTKLTIKGQGGSGAQVTLTAATTNPKPASSTSTIVLIAGTDKTAVNAILTKNGITAPDSTKYNLAAASGWQTGATAVSTVGITVNNASEVISMVTYDVPTGNLVLTGLNFNTSSAIDVTKFTITGQGGAGAQVVLTAETINPYPVSSTSTRIVIAGTDKTAVNAILTKNGTTAPDSTTYNVATVSGWQTGAAFSTVGIIVSNAAEVISSATYDASNGQLVLTGLNFNTSAAIDVTKLTITGQGGAGAQVTLTAATTNPTPTCSTSATVAISGTDKTAVNGILNQNGITAPDSTTYNVATASGWQTGTAAVSTVGIIVSNAAEVISSATYDASNGQLMLTGLNFNTLSTIDVTKLTITGQGGAGTQVTLTAATSNPIPAFSTSATVTIAGTDKTAVNAILTKNGTTAPDSTTYNVAAASDWQTGAGAVSAGIAVNNAAEVISGATYDASDGQLVLTGLNFNTSSTIDVIKLTIKGQCGAGAQVTLTAATSNPNPASTTSAIVAIAGIDKTVDAILNQNGATASDSTKYSIVAASGWQTGAAVSTVGITVSNAVEVINSATYNASNGQLVLTGLNFRHISNNRCYQADKVKGQGGAGTQVALTAATSNPTPASTTSATVAIAGADKTAVNTIMTQNGTIAPDLTIYNVEAASGWQTGATAVSSGINVSNAAEVISMATYDASTGNLVLTGLNFNTAATIDATKLTITGQGGACSQVTLTSATVNHACKCYKCYSSHSRSR